MTNSDKALRRYCLQVSKYLVCKQQTKKRLISGLQQELTDNDLAGSGYPEIVSNYGDPKAVAACLMEAVSDDEFSEADKRQKGRAIWILAVAVVLLVAFGGGYLYHSSHREQRPPYEFQLQNLPEGFVQTDHFTDDLTVSTTYENRATGDSIILVQNYDKTNASDIPLDIQTDEAGAMAIWSIGDYSLQLWYNGTIDTNTMKLYVEGVS